MTGSGSSASTGASALRRRAPWAAMAVVLVVALAVGSWPHGSPSVASRTRALSAKLKCPACESQSVVSSDAPSANAIRVAIRRRLEAGQSEEQITDYLVGRYGEKILLEPSRTGVGAVVWAVPVVAVVLAAVAIGFRFRTWRAKPATGAVSTEDRTLVDAARRTPSSSTQ